MFHMSRFTGNSNPCTNCGRPTTEPRRGLCKGCHLREHRGHLAAGPCAVCGTGDRRVLRRHLLSGGPVTLCANDSAIAGRRPLSLDQLRAEVRAPSDRRGQDRRRGDRRVPIVRRARVEVDGLLDDRRRIVDRRA